MSSLRWCCLFLAALSSTCLKAEAPPASNSSLLGRVVDAQGAAVSGAMLFVYSSVTGIGSPSAWHPLAHSDQDGNVSLPLTPGVYQVVVIARPFRAAISTVRVLPLHTTGVLWRLQLPKDPCKTPGWNCNDRFGAPRSRPAPHPETPR